MILVLTQSYQESGLDYLHPIGFDAFNVVYNQQLILSHFLELAVHRPLITHVFNLRVQAVTLADGSVHAYCTADLYTTKERLERHRASKNEAP